MAKQIDIMADGTEVFVGGATADIAAVSDRLATLESRQNWRTSALTIYVRTDGNDSNDGLTNTATGAVASWTGVFDALRKTNVRHTTVTVSFQAGTFAGTTIIGEAFQGAGSTYLIVRGIAGETFFSSSFNIYQVRCAVYDIEFKNTVYCRENASLLAYGGCVFSGGPVYAMDGGAMQFISPVFKGADSASGAVQVYRDGYVNFSTDMTFSGAFTIGIEVYAGGKVSTATTNNIPITFEEASFSTAFMRVGLYGGGEIGIRGTPVVTGTATGRRYVIQNGGKITGQTKAQLDALAVGNQAGTISGSAVTHSGQFISSGDTTNSGYLLADGTDILDVSKQVLHVRDEKPSGTGGGSFTGGLVWRTRDLNTMVENSIPGAFLANNQITLPIGTYEIFVAAPAYAVNLHIAALYNVSANTYLEGGTVNSQNAYNGYTNSIVLGKIICLTPQVFEVRHICSLGYASYGFGSVISIAGSTEKYTNVIIRRLA